MCLHTLQVCFRLTNSAMDCSANYDLLFLHDYVWSVSGCLLRLLLWRCFQLFDNLHGYSHIRPISSDGLRKSWISYISLPYKYSSHSYQSSTLKRKTQLLFLSNKLNLFWLAWKNKIKYNTISTIFLCLPGCLPWDSI